MVLLRSGPSWYFAILCMLAALAFLRCCRRLWWCYSILLF